MGICQLPVRHPRERELRLGIQEEFESSVVYNQFASATPRRKAIHQLGQTLNVQAELATLPIASSVSGAPPVSDSPIRRIGIFAGFIQCDIPEAVYSQWKTEQLTTYCLPLLRLAIDKIERVVADNGPASVAGTTMSSIGRDQLNWTGHAFSTRGSVLETKPILYAIP